ncbi:hypothetical protein PRZ48_014799 [Zasmidium cellare]|uniref:F-box domain-containing protein n=1 Tax=Zasmidium cellare TaxID=395010 RepID=A0ABR0DZX9_ZASCE|nr:hypothetical protein PRZ48_014799 [Zasmidium cellare]
MMPITDLPPEVLTHISSYLDKQNLCSFASVNHLTRSSAAPWLYYKLTIRGRDSAPALCSILARTSYAKHVRHLTVGRVGQRSDADEFTASIPLNPYIPDRRTTQSVYNRDKSWQPVANLIQSLPSLRHLVWSCKQQVPPCVVKVLTSDKHLASCKLHVRTFALRSVEGGDFDPHELDLVRLPQLYSIWFIHDVMYGSSYGSPELIFKIIRYMAPNLRHLKVREGTTRRTSVPGLGSTLSALEQESGHSPHPKASLDELVLTGDDLIPRVRLVEWSEHTDFRVLGALLIHQAMSLDAIEWLAQTAMPSLRNLFIILRGDSPNSDQEADCSTPGGKLLLSVPPLRALGVVGQLSRPRLHDAMSRHGSSLTQLDLRPGGAKKHRLVLGPEEVEWISRYCLTLEILEMTVKRSQGDSQEVAMYRAIGRMPRLQTLILTLDSSERGVLTESLSDNEKDLSCEEDFDELDMEILDWNTSHSVPRKGHLRKMLINSALDETLARSIYDTMAASKPARGLPFTAIYFHSKGGGDFGNGIPQDEQLVFFELGRHWRLEATGTDGLVVKENGTGLNRYFEEGTWTRSHDLSARIEPVFRRLWPKKSEEGSWIDDWHSFPLCK